MIYAIYIMIYAVNAAENKNVKNKLIEVCTESALDSDGSVEVRSIS